MDGMDESGMTGAEIKGKWAEIMAPPQEGQFLHDDDPRRIQGLVNEVAGKMQSYLSLFAQPGGREQFVRSALIRGWGRVDIGWLATFGANKIPYHVGKDTPEPETFYRSEVYKLALSQPEVLALIEPQVKSVLPQVDTASDGRDAAYYFCNSILYGGAAEGEIGIAEKKTRYISPVLVNPMTAYFVERAFDNWLSPYLPPHKDKVIELGYVLGLFDPNHPKAEIYRKTVAPFIDDDAPRVIRRLKPRERAEDILDSPRLRKLKGFWGGVFNTYWTALARVEGRSPAPLEREAAQRAKKRLTEVPDSLPAREAEALKMAAYDETRKKLNREIVALVSAYRGESASFAEIAALFNHDTAHLVFACLADGLSRKNNGKILEETTERMEKLVDPKGERLAKMFGPDWEQLAAGEKLAVVGFTAFVANGAMIKGSEAAVRVLQSRVIPELARVHDKGRKFTSHIPVERSEFDLAKYTTMAEVGRRRLSAMQLEDELVDASHPAVVAEAQKKIDRFRELAELSEGVYRESSRIGDLEVWNWLTKIAAWGSLGMGVGSAVAYKELSFQGYLVIGLGATLWLEAAKTFVNYAKWVGDWKRTVKLFSDELEEKAKRIPVEKAKYLYQAIARGILVAGIMTGAHMGKEALRNSAERAGERAMEVATVVGERILEKWYGIMGKEYNVDITAKSRGSGVEPGLGNSAEMADRSTDPRFYVYDDTTREPNPTFWIDRTCEAETSGTGFDCKVAEPASVLVGGDSLDSISDMKRYISEMVGQGYIVRINVGGSHFQIPAGYMPVRVVGVGLAIDGGVYNPVSGLDVVAKPQLGASPVWGVVYAPVAGDGYEGQFIPQTAGEPILTPEDFTRPELAKVKPIWEWARTEYANKLNSGITNREILEGIKQRFAELGLDYGFARFDTGGAASHRQLLEALFAYNADGSMVNPQMICNQFSYGEYLIAQAAGMEVYLVTGYQQDAETGWGGQDARAHQIVMFKNEQGLWEVHESTLPDRDNPTYGEVPVEINDVLEAVEEGEKVRWDLLAAMGLVGASAVAAWGVGSEKMRKVLEKREEKYRQVLTGAPTSSISASYQTLLTLAELYDTPETTDLAGSREEYARQLAADALALATGEAPAGQVAGGDILRTNLDRDLKALKENPAAALPWLDTTEKRDRVREGGRLVLRQLNKLRKEKGEGLNEAQKRQLYHTQKLLDRAVKLVK